MRISPTAMGMLVCEPSGCSDPIHSPNAGAKYPSSTPAPMARKIHSVRKRSRKLRRLGFAEVITVLAA
jgi:hypothetical protein